MWTNISADDVPSRDLFDWFSDVVASELAPTALSTDRPDSFDAEVSALDLGALQVSKFRYSPLRSRRTPALIRRSDPQQYQLALVTSGKEWIAQRRNESALSAGDLVFWDSSHPWEAGVPDASGHVEAIVLQFPRSAIPLRPERLDAMLARPIPARTGMAAILAQFIVSLQSQGADCRPQDLARLGDIAVDLTAACLAQQTDAPQDLSPEARTRALRARINRFVEYNLGDPELTPRAVAEHHSVSLRTLYTLFASRDGSPELTGAGTGTGIAADIRRRRLERCRQDLATPELHNHTVQSIAARWGFTSATVFARAFRDAYGTTPTRYRQEAMAAHGSNVPARNVKTPRTPRTPPSRTAP
ncbi:helix-turn-helix domain-containing protein [Streptomyces sp. NPDC048603]|uniref:AraC family transcriptional regulator n=1 Tax=Streptomyces sp. NPDC048603 TaxID=3365577 RepID=UPI003718DC81